MLHDTVIQECNMVKFLVSTFPKYMIYMEIMQNHELACQLKWQDL